MPHHGSTKNDEEIGGAMNEALKGAVVGAAKWGVAFAAFGAVAYRLSPLYKSLTIQFKTYIQMSGMVLGGMLEADKRTVAYQHQMRHQRRLAREAALWRQYEEDYEAQMNAKTGASQSAGKVESSGEMK